MKPLKHTDRVRVSAYLKADTQQIMRELMLQIEGSVSNAIALIIAQHQSISIQFPSEIYQASLVDFTESDYVPGYKLYQIYLDKKLSDYVEEIAINKSCSESVAINRIIREWALVVSKRS